MTDTQIIPEAVLELIGPDGSRRVVRVAHTPFLIGRGGETGNHLQLPDRRISRECAALVYEKGDFRLQDRGQRRGLFINGERVDSRPRSEEHTSELQSPCNLVCRLLLEKKNNTTTSNRSLTSSS